jgi:uncharacterized delta-60 repeat protein
MSYFSRSSSRRVIPCLEVLEDRLAPAGTLDHTFNVTGQVITPFTATSSDQPTAVAVQPDGKIVVAGSTTSAAGNADMAVLRLNPDGTLDPSFGQGGKVVVPIDAGGNNNDVATLVKIQGDGKILLAGTASLSGSTAGFAFVRLNPNGTLDPGFGTSGVTTESVGAASQGKVLDLVFQPDGGGGPRILAAGSISSSGPFSVGITRLTASGQVDTTFGVNGLVTSQTGNFSPNVLAIQNDGKVVALGTTFLSLESALFFSLIRINPDGTNDPGFAFTGAGSSGNPATMTLQPDGKILVAGAGLVQTPSFINTQGLTIARLNSTGSLDTTFNGSGSNFQNSGTFAGVFHPLQMIVQSDGRIVVLAGYAAVIGQPLTNYVVARYTSAGALDTSFHGGGLVQLPFKLASPNNPAGGLAQQADGKLLLAGAVPNVGATTSAFGVARLTAAVADAALTPGQFDPATGTWYLRNSNSGGAPTGGQFQYGGVGWIPVVGDWNGDGLVTVGVVDPSTMTWYLRNSNSAGAPDIPPFQYGGIGWIPVVGDWTGNGITTIGVVDPSTMTWYLRNSSSAGAPDIAPFSYGGVGWKPVTGDWNGDGITTIGVVDPSTMTWYLRNSNSAGAPDIAPFSYGGVGWKPVTGDWNGDGITTIGVIEPASARWYLRDSNSAGAPTTSPFPYGLGSWDPLAGVWTTTLPSSPTGLTDEPLRGGLL